MKFLYFNIFIYIYIYAFFVRAGRIFFLLIFLSLVRNSLFEDTPADFSSATNFILRGIFSYSIFCYIYTSCFIFSIINFSTNKSNLMTKNQIHRLISRLRKLRKQYFTILIIRDKKRSSLILHLIRSDLFKKKKT